MRGLIASALLCLSVAAQDASELRQGSPYSYSSRMEGEGSAALTGFLFGQLFANVSLQDQVNTLRRRAFSSAMETLEFKYGGLMRSGGSRCSFDTGISVQGKAVNGYAILFPRTDLMEWLRPFVTGSRETLAKMPARFDHLFRVSPLTEGRVSFSDVPDGEFELVIRVERSVLKFGKPIDRSFQRYGRMTNHGGSCKFTVFERKTSRSKVEASPVTRLIGLLPPRPAPEKSRRNWKNVRK